MREADESQPLIERVKKSSPSQLNVDLLERDISRFLSFAQTICDKTKKAAKDNPKLSEARETLKHLIEESRDLLLTALQQDKSAEVKPIRKVQKRILNGLDKQKKYYKDALRHAESEDYPQEYIQIMEDARWIIIEERIAQQEKLDGAKSRESLLVEIFEDQIQKIHKLVEKRFKSQHDGASLKATRERAHQDSVQSLADHGIEAEAITGMARGKRLIKGMNPEKKTKNRETAYDALLSTYADIVKVLKHQVDSPSR